MSMVKEPPDTGREGPEAKTVEDTRVVAYIGQRVVYVAFCAECDWKLHRYDKKVLDRRIEEHWAECHDDGRNRREWEWT
jgi:hypothetical protein